MLVWELLTFFFIFIIRHFGLKATYSFSLLSLSIMPVWNTFKKEVTWRLLTQWSSSIDPLRMSRLGTGTWFNIFTASHLPPSSFLCVPTLSPRAIMKRTSRNHATDRAANELSYRSRWRQFCGKSRLRCSSLKRATDRQFSDVDWSRWKCLTAWQDLFHRLSNLVPVCGAVKLQVALVIKICIASNLFFISNTCFNMKNYSQPSHVVIALGKQFP